MTPDKICWVRQSIDTISDEEEYVTYYITTETENYLGDFVEVNVHSGDQIGNKSAREDYEVFGGTIVECFRYIGRQRWGICEIS